MGGYVLLPKEQKFPLLFSLMPIVIFSLIVSFTLNAFQGFSIIKPARYYASIVITLETFSSKGSHSLRNPSSSGNIGGALSFRERYRRRLECLPAGSLH
jgi:hypothetical protein